MAARRASRQGGRKAEGMQVHYHYGPAQARGPIRRYSVRIASTGSSFAARAAG